MGTTDRSEARRVAAVQMQAVLGDVDANLEQAGRLVSGAARDGAEWITLPEFFTSGVAFLPSVAAAAQPIDGPAVRAMQDWAAEHDVLLSGSLLVRDPDGEVRNAVLLVDRTGIRGRHDKDLPTMWENALYVGGSDDGVAVVDDTTIGLAVCWELTRRQTVTRLAGRVDVVLGGSGWWTVPRWQPRRVFDTWDAANTVRATEAPARFAAAALPGTLRARDRCLGRRRDRPRDGSHAGSAGGGHRPATAPLNSGAAARLVLADATRAAAAVRLAPAALARPAVVREAPALRARRLRP
jgi:predicted amidohydrolase